MTWNHMQKQEKSMQKYLHSDKKKKKKKKNLITQMCEQHYFLTWICLF